MTSGNTPKQGIDRTAGTVIRDLRVAAGLSIRELASIAGTSPAYLSRVERGHRTPTDRWVWSVTAALGRHLGERAA